jgi:hypothetical protein
LLGQPGLAEAALGDFVAQYAVGLIEFEHLVFELANQRLVVLAED